MSGETSRKIQSSSLKRNSGRFIILWGATEKEIPPRPEDPSALPADDSRHWYDMEFAGLNTGKSGIPDSPRTGPEGKTVIYLQPGGGFDYLDQYASTLEKSAAKSGMTLRILDAAWDINIFNENVRKTIELQPDMVVLNPENHELCTNWYKALNEAGIPVTGSNFLANNESHRYLLAWTGPDDWGQSRLLARHLADGLDKQGGYAILQHLEGTSSYYARTWGVITELKKYAPSMNFLDARPGMEEEKAEEALRYWLKHYGEDLKGLFCADDSIMMTTVSRVLEESGRKDILCVAAGSSRTGISLVLEGRLLATAYQSPVVDGEIAMQTIIDWFEGVPLEAVRYLPKHIITIRDAAEFIDIDPKVESLDLEILFRSIRNFDWQGTYYFFGDLYLRFIKTRVLPMEHFQGMCLEILTGIIHILKSDGLSVEDSLGNYDGMVKHLLKDKDVSSVLDWLNQLAQQAISRRMEKNNRRTPIQEIIDYIDSHISEPISIKTLSHQFKISHSYLGQMFKKETGIKFTDYLNAQRVEKAKIILKGRGVTINTVARDLGYTNPDYFYKVFKKLTGQSAGEFIRHQ
jgi:ABC-type sugar transport system substrate-binding protein/AraC-like DNA-binding protein